MKTCNIVFFFVNVFAMLALVHDEYIQKMY